MTLPTVREFRTDPALWNRLAQLLDDPVFQQAEMLLKQLMEPRMPESMSDDAARRMGAYSAGAYSALRSLRILSKKAPDGMDETPDEFSGWAGAYLLTPQEIEQLNQQRVEKPRRKSSTEK